VRSSIKKMELFQYQDREHTNLLSLDQCQELKSGELREITTLVPMVLAQEPTISDLKPKQAARLKLEQGCVKTSAKMKRQVQELMSTQKMQQKVSPSQAIKVDKI
jgi:hypothetical protein